MKTEVKIRAAVPADAPTIIKLILALAEYEKLAPPDEEARARLIADAFKTQPRFEIFLAELEGKGAVGYIFIFETYSTFLALPTLYLEDFFVLAEYRSLGIGYALFSYCAREALRRGCGRLEWQVLAWNRLALDFYDRQGGQHLQDWYTYRLDQEALQRFSS